MRGVLLTLLLVTSVAGCTQAPSGAQIVSQRVGTWPPYELAGQNVSFDGQLDLSFTIDVPSNSSALYVSWWAAEGTRSESNRTIVSGPCPIRQTGHAAGSLDATLWCSLPRRGTQVVTYRWTGSLTGRVCIISVPTGTTPLESELQCRFFPYFRMCSQDLPPSFCDRRPPAPSGS